MNTAYEKILSWYEQFAPGLEPLPIPENASIEGPVEPLIPYGLQYRVKIGDAVYPRHQAGPGVTVIVTDTKRVALVSQFREETEREMLKACGGFAAYRIDVARALITVFNAFDTVSQVRVTKDTHPIVYAFIQELLMRDYEWEMEGHDCVIVDRVTGHPNISICSIIAVVTLSEEEFNEATLPVVMDVDDALSFPSIGVLNTREAVKHIKLLSKQ